jgi:hypothetical protein
MDINRKLDEIRQKPEHIRIRYVWGAVAVSMVVIFTVWIFSLKASFRSATLESQQNPVPGIREQIEEQTKNLPSIGDFSEVPGPNNFTGEGINPQENTGPAPGDNESPAPQENMDFNQPLE